MDQVLECLSPMGPSPTLALMGLWEVNQQIEEVFLFLFLSASQIKERRKGGTGSEGEERGRREEGKKTGRQVSKKEGRKKGRRERKKRVSVVSLNFLTAKTGVINHYPRDRLLRHR